MKNAVLPYGGKHHQGNLNQDSKGRCLVALQKAKELEDAYLFFGVGNYEKIKGLQATTVQFFEEEGWPKEKVILNSKGHNTYTETLSLIELVSRYAPEKVTVVTSWYHVPRVWMCWTFLSKSKVRYFVAWPTETLFKSIAWELLGIWKTLYEILFSPKSETTKAPH